jgi:hypothetical protein
MGKSDIQDSHRQNQNRFELIQAEAARISSGLKVLHSDTTKFAGETPVTHSTGNPSSKNGHYIEVKLPRQFNTKLSFHVDSATIEHRRYGGQLRPILHIVAVLDLRFFVCLDVLHYRSYFAGAFYRDWILPIELCVVPIKLRESDYFAADVKWGLI